VIVGEPSGPCLTVVGVAENARERQVVEEPTPQYFLPLDAAHPPRALVVRALDGRASDVAGLVRTEVLERAAMEEVRVDLMSETLAPQLRSWRLGAQLFGGFGVLALIVTAVGIYSTLAYLVTQRVHEMGVRTALGARPSGLLRLMLWRGVWPAAAGIAVGVVLALGLGEFLRSLLYGVETYDPVALAGGSAVIMAATVLASLVPAARAANSDPATALRAE